LARSAKEKGETTASARYGREAKDLTPDPLVCDPAPSLIATAGATLAVAPLELPDPSPPRFALEGDHAAHRTVGSDSSPHQPSRATRRVVPRDPRDGARRHPRGEPATGHGAALLPGAPGHARPALPALAPLGLRRILLPPAVAHDATTETLPSIKTPPADHRAQ